MRVTFAGSLFEVAVDQREPLIFANHAGQVGHHFRPDPVQKCLDAEFAMHFVLDRPAASGHGFKPIQQVFAQAGERSGGAGLDAAVPQDAPGDGFGAAEEFFDAPPVNPLVGAVPQL